MTDEQIINIADSYSFTWDEGIIEFARDIEQESRRAVLDEAIAVLETAYARIAALESQIAAAEKQEPVAVIGPVFQLLYCRENWSEGLKVGMKLYAAPLQSEGLRKDAEPAECTAFEWPPLPDFPKPFLDSARSGSMFTEHQMQGYANAYGEAVRSVIFPSVAGLTDREKDAQDAERYRWLRDDAHNGFPIEGAKCIGNFQVSQKVRDGEAQYYGGRFLDDAIDAALAQQEKP